MTDERDQRLADRIRSAWGRPELTEGERVDLDAAVRARVRAPRPRRWALPIGLLASAAAAVAVVALAVREPVGDAGPWLDALVEARAVVRGEQWYSPLFGDSAETETDAPDPVWDFSAETARHESSGLELGYQYEVLAYWLAPPTGDEAELNPSVP